MKKLFSIIIFSIFFLFSCGKVEKKNINIYVDKNLSLLINDIINVYENKNEDTKINITFEKPSDFNKLDIVITADRDIFSPIIDVNEENKNEQVKESKEETTQNLEIGLLNEFKESIFTDDDIVIVGRRKINKLADLAYSKVAIPEYENLVGKLFVESFSEMGFFKEISKGIEYTDDTISAMQKVDLYETDYAIINSLLLNSVKNSENCYTVNEINYETPVIYRKYIKKESPEHIQNFYIFLESDRVQKIINTNKKI